MKHQACDAYSQVNAKIDEAINLACLFTVHHVTWSSLSDLWRLSIIAGARFKK